MSTTLANKIDFEAIISVTNANPNGDPLGGNRPRTDYDGFGEISDVCIKRKIRNRMQDSGHAIFVYDDGKNSLKDRAKSIGLEKITDVKEYHDIACDTWLDVRTFGQVFAFGNKNSDKEKSSDKEKKSKKSKEFACKSVGVRGPVSIHLAKSADPVDIQSMQITKSVSGDKEDGKERGSDTMGMKHFVRFGLYIIKGSINVQLAEKTGFTEEDAETVKECLRTLFVNDSSAARPDGSMEVVKLYWWKHNCKDGQYPSAKVHRLVNVSLNEGIAEPTSADDYVIKLDSLDGLACEEIDGI